MVALQNEFGAFSGFGDSAAGAEGSPEMFEERSEIARAFGWIWSSRYACDDGVPFSAALFAADAGRLGSGGCGVARGVCGAGARFEPAVHAGDGLFER